MNRALAFKYPAGRALFALAAAMNFGLAASIPARAAGFPNHPVEMTVLFGGSSATIAQLLADAMAKELGVAVAAVSRTGESGAAGYSYVKSTPPNGYNIVWNSGSIIMGYHSGKMQFSYTAFDGVARVGMEVPAMAVLTESGWKNLKEFGAAARKQKLKVGIPGRGSFTHLSSAALFNKMGVDVVYVPYGKGSAPVELLAGHIDAALQWPSEFTPQIEAGKLRVITVTSAKRIPVMPKVPTAKEQGYDVDRVLWRGVAAPKGTPKPAIRRLEQAIKNVVDSKSFRERCKQLGFEPAFLPAEQFDRFIAKDDAEIAKLMANLGLKKSN